MLTEEQQRWYAEHGTAQEKAFALKYANRQAGLRGVFRTIWGLIVIVLLFVTIPLAIFIEGRLTQVRHLTGTWVGVLRAPATNGAQGNLDPLWSEATRNMVERELQAQETAQREGSRGVSLEVHRDLRHLLAPGLAGTIVVCDVHGHRFKYPFSTVDLGVSYLRFLLPEDHGGSYEDSLYGNVSGSSLTVTMRDSGKVVQGDLTQKPATTFEDSCQNLARTHQIAK